MAFSRERVEGEREIGRLPYGGEGEGIRRRRRLPREAKSLVS